MFVRGRVWRLIAACSVLTAAPCIPRAFGQHATQKDEFGYWPGFTREAESVTPAPTPYRNAPPGLRIMSPPTKPTPRLIDDYAQSFEGDSWDFDEGDTEGISAFQRLTDQQVKDGVLSFTTQANARLTWDGLLVGAGWRYWDGIGLRLRIRQSLPESTVTARFDPRGYRNENSVTLTGTDWQEIELDGPQVVHKKTRLLLSFDKPDNRIEIDWLRVGRYTGPVNYRKTLEVKGPVRDAWCFWRAHRQAVTVYVNGTEVAHDQLNPFDIGPALKPGKNVIALFTEPVTFRTDIRRTIIFAGTVRYEGGGLERLVSDATWRYAENNPEGWTAVEFDDAEWPFATARELEGHRGLTAAARATKAGFRQELPAVGYMRPSYGGIPSPIFDEAEGISMDVAIPGGDTREYAATYLLREALTGEEVATGSLSEVGVRGRDRVFALACPGVKRGGYHLRIELAEGEELVDSLEQEVVVIGKIAQPTVKGADYREGMDLELVDEIDCTSDGEQHAFADLGRLTGKEEALSRVITTPLGRCRLSGPGYADWFGYRIRVRHPGAWHLVEVEYPEDRFRMFGAAISEPEQKGVVGYARTVGDGFPVSGRIETLRFLYVPAEREAVIRLQNLCDWEATCAVSRIRIYELRGELPAMASPNALDEILYGYANERECAIANSLAVAPGGRSALRRVTDLDVTYTLLLGAYENMIRWARFSGQNAIVLPVQQYYQIYYQRPGPRTVMWGGSYEKDTIGLMARLAELNGLKVILNLEWSNRDVLEQLDRFTDEQVHQGADTIRPVMRDGKQFRRYAGIGYNFQHPRVEAELLATVDDLLAQAAAYPAVKGLSFYQIPDYAPCAYRRGGDATDVSFDDTSIRRFAAEAGIEVPVADDDPERFGKRSEWILEHAWEQYVQWRCDAVTSVVQRIATKVRAGRPDWTCSFHWGANQMHGFPSVEAGLRSWGIDAPAIGEIEGVQQGIKEWIGSEKVYWNRYQRFYDFVLYSPEGDTFGMTRAVRQTNLDVLIPPERRCSWGFNFFVDSSRSGTVCYEMAPCREHYLAHYADILSHSTPTFHGFGVGDNSLHSGPEQEVRTVARVVRTLPAGVYQTLTRSGLDRNIAVRALEREPHLYFYVVNPFPWPVSGSLTMSRAGKVLDLIENVQLEGQEIPLELGASEIKTFRADLAGGARPASAQVALCQEGVQELRAKRDRAREALAALKGGEVSLDTNTTTLEQIEATVAEVNQALEAGAYARVYRLLCSRPIVYLLAANPPQT